MRDLALVLIDREVLQNAYELNCGGLHGNSGLLEIRLELETVIRTQTCKTIR